VRLPIEPSKVWALTKRDFYNWTTYKSQAITTTLGALVAIGIWGFTGSFRNVPVPEYNTDYVSFLVVGVLVTGVILPLSAGVQKQLNPWTLETILMTGIKTPTFVLGTSLWTYIFSVLVLIPQMFVGVYYFHAHLYINYVSLIVAILISSLIIFSLAMISTGVRMVTKVTDPVTWGLNIAASVLAGVAYPVSSLPYGLSTVAWILPQTWIYHIVRLSSLESGSLLDPQILFPFLITLAYAAIFLPIAVIVYRWGLNRAKRDGTLGWY
jgi:ABC-type multidrug transport system permease subunit